MILIINLSTKFSTLQIIYLFAKILHDVFKKHAEIFGKTSAYFGENMLTFYYNESLSFLCQI